MKKELKLANGNIIIFETSSAFCGEMVVLRKVYFKDGKLEKSFNLARWDDYGFSAYVKEKEKNINLIEFDIPFDDPLYFCFNRFLNEKEKIIIDTDDIAEDNLKTMTIRRKENLDIELVFENKLQEDKTFQKFYVFIKNIVSDIRSKIDCYGYDTKYRLHEFFMDVRNTITEEFHQMTVDEYILIKKYETKRQN